MESVRLNKENHKEEDVMDTLYELSNLNKQLCEEHDVVEQEYKKYYYLTRAIERGMESLAQQIDEIAARIEALEKKDTL